LALAARVEALLEYVAEAAAFEYLRHPVEPDPQEDGNDSFHHQAVEPDSLIAFVWHFV